MTYTYTLGGGNPHSNPPENPSGGLFVLGLLHVVTVTT